ncbi:hypothetical protein Avbf_06679 [Armadillidium vulgare]|nr:hypothetical protein Avbf_06679 [Armadillidium vulgare]
MKGLSFYSTRFKQPLEKSQCGGPPAIHTVFNLLHFLFSLSYNIIYNYHLRKKIITTIFHLISPFIFFFHLFSLRSRIMFGTSIQMLVLTRDINTCMRFNKRLQNGEKVFAVHKINEEFKYGEVSSFQINYSSIALKLFEDVKQCLNSKNFCTFIKICCNEKNVTPFVIIETFDQCLCNEFIKLCTGECGPSYKGSTFKKGYNKRIKSSNDLTNVLSVEKILRMKVKR